MSSLVITIDGPAGSGKSSVAAALAGELHLYQVDSGAFYRTCTWLALKYAAEHGISVAETVSHSDFRDHMHNIDLQPSYEGRLQVISVDNRVLTDEIRTSEITENIGTLADAVWVRHYVNERIRDLAERYPLVADGRDMGSEVFPDADAKFFITASIEERARRRFSEFQSRQADITLAEVESQIAIRDEQDRNRPVGALRPAVDAILIDTTTQNLEAVLQTVKEHLKANKSEKIRRLKI